ncbi:MAG TPA: hypothetical protein VF753_17955 [Terriglobales bacterium]
MELLLGGEWNFPLWKRLAIDVKDRFAPEKLPPLILTSRPVDVGMLESDRLNMPWFQTVFTNIGDVISPETLPPLELESQPIDVGELISDQMSHMWWSSLLRSLADKAAPERLPALQLTSKPVDPGGLASSMLLPQWSSVIDTPKVFLPDKPKTELASVPLRVAPPTLKPDPAAVEFAHVLQMDLKRDLRRSAFRQRIWIGLAVAEVAFLFYSAIWLK